MSFAGAQMRSSSESCGEVSPPHAAESSSASYSYDNPFASSEVTSVTSSCSIQCLNCKRLTSKLSKVYDDMHKLRRQNEILLAQKLLSKPRSENPLLDERQCNYLEETEAQSSPGEETEETQESAAINFAFCVNVNFVPEESGSRGACGADESEGDVRGEASADSSAENPGGAGVCEESEANCASVPPLQAMITIQLKMTDELFKAPTITCIEKSGDGLGPGKWLIELENPMVTDEELKAGGAKESMHREVSHLLQTIREFFNQQIKGSVSGTESSDASEMAWTGAVPKKGTPKDQPPSRKSSSSSGKQSSPNHSPDSGSSSSLCGEFSDSSCPICSMVYPQEFNRKERVEHKQCHLWPRYEDK